MNEANIIYYLGTKDRVVPQLEVYCTSQGFLLKRYSPVEHNQLGYLLLIEPVLIRSKYYTLSSLWKNWLLENSPQTKLLVASYRQGDHPNALNLLNLPTDLGTWLKKLRPVGAYQPQYAGYKEIDGHKYDEYVDPWKFFPLPLGLDIKEEIIKFLDGHDRIHSFVDQLIRLRKSMMEVKNLLETKKDSGSRSGAILKEKENINLSWKALYARWQNYQDFFEWLPFKETAHILIQELQDLHQHIEELNKDKRNKVQPNSKFIDNINNLLSREIQRYVYYEAYW
jgi:hypothetical protein